MRGGSLLAGLIVIALGAAGLSSMYGAVALPFLTPLINYLDFQFALLLFGGITVIGFVVLADGFRGSETKLSVKEMKELGLTGKSAEAPADPMVTAAPSSTVKADNFHPTEMDITILRNLSEGKKPRDISKLTGVSEQVILSRMDVLRNQRYTTYQYRLTEKGFEALRREDHSYFELMPMDIAILSNLSEGKKPDEKARMGVLYTRGFITDKNQLTEKGYQALHEADSAGYELSELDEEILRNLSQGTKASEIAKKTGTGEAMISGHIEILHTRGYLNDKNLLTEKGYEAIKEKDRAMSQGAGATASTAQEQPQEPMGS